MGAMWSLGAHRLVGVAAGATDHRPGDAIAARLACQSRWRHDARTLRKAFGNSSYLLLHGSFLTCGFHIAFLVTHLPGEVDLCGLPASVASWSLAIIGLSNIAGSFAAGWMLNHFRGKYILFWHVRLAHVVDFALSRRAQNRVDVLSDGCRTRLFMAGNGAADRRRGRQTYSARVTWRRSMA